MLVSNINNNRTVPLEFQEYTCCTCSCCNTSCTWYICVYFYDRSLISNWSRKRERLQLNKIQLCIFKVNPILILVFNEYNANYRNYLQWNQTWFDKCHHCRGKLYIDVNQCWCHLECWYKSCLCLVTLQL